MISEDQAVVEFFNKFFINKVPNMKISPNHNYDTDFIVTNDQVTNALNKFRNYQSIVIIKSKRKIDECFSFGPVTYDDILRKQIILILLKHLNNLIFQLICKTKFRFFRRVLSRKYQLQYFEINVP